MNQKLSCSNCGACCMHWYESMFVPISHLERKRIPKKYQRRVVERGEDTEDEEFPISGWPYTLPSKESYGYTVCVALKGKVGREVKCDIYAQRPAQCASFEVGSSECHERRRLVLGIQQEES